MAKSGEKPSARSCISVLLRRVRRLRKRLLRDLESVRRNLECRNDLPPSRRLMGQEVLCLIAEDLAALEQAANVCERRVMGQEKVPVAEKLISLSDSDASFIVKGGWNAVVGYRPQLARSGRGFVTALVLPRGNAADSPHLVTKRARWLNELPGHIAAFAPAPGAEPRPIFLLALGDLVEPELPLRNRD